MHHSSPRRQYCETRGGCLRPDSIHRPSALQSSTIPSELKSRPSSRVIYRATYRSTTVVSFYYTVLEMGGVPFGWEALVSTVGLIHLVMCPYTKVEESFNVQAIHDVLYHGLDVDKYDHLEFPGVVPRTFIGPIVISLTAAPFVYIAKFFETDKFFTQYIVRATLGGYVMVGLFAFWNAVQEKFGPDLKKWMILVTMSQFHFIFYSTRPLPNIFALSLVLLAFSAWLRQQHVRFLWFSGAAILIFRAELAMYLGIILLTELAAGRLSFRKFIITCIPAGIVLLGMTVLVDSYFWRRWLWPEGEVFWYNTVMNKSSHWGVSFNIR